MMGGRVRGNTRTVRGESWGSATSEIYEYLASHLSFPVRLLALRGGGNARGASPTRRPARVRPFQSRGTSTSTYTVVCFMIGNFKAVAVLYF